MHVKRSADGECGLVAAGIEPLGRARRAALAAPIWAAWVSPNGLRQTAVWVKANVRLLLTTHLYRIRLGLRWHGVADPLSGGRNARDRPPHRSYPRQRQRPTLNGGP